MKRLLPWLLPLIVLGCGPGPNGNGDPPAEILDPEPVGAPVEQADGRLTCVGNDEQSPPDSSVLELVGYVRTLADPDAVSPTPAASIEAFTADGVSLGTTFADPAKDGRATVAVPVTSDGFTGYVVVTAPGYLDWSFSVSRTVTNTDFAAWAWLTTRAEADQQAAAVGIVLDSIQGLLVGVVHDCDGFGVRYSVVQVGGSTDDIHYVEGFGAVAGRTFTSETGRFVAANLPPGTVSVKAFGRLEAGGPLVLLSSAQVVIEADRIHAVALLPRVGLE